MREQIEREKQSAYDQDFVSFLPISIEIRSSGRGRGRVEEWEELAEKGSNLTPFQWPISISLLNGRDPDPCRETTTKLNVVQLKYRKLHFSC